MHWKGVIIQESLKDTSVLELVDIVKTEEERLEGEEGRGMLHFHKVNVEDSKMEDVLAKAPDALQEGWYMHFAGDGTMYVIFPGKVFVLHRGKPEEIAEAREYGKSSGILEEQMDFARLLDNPWDE